MKILAKTILVLILASSLFAQQPEKNNPEQASKKDATPEQKLPETFYKLSFAMYELQDGRKTNERDYIVVGKTNSRPSARIVITTRVPVHMDEAKLQYVDAGLDLNCSLKEKTDNKLEAECEVGISEFVRAEQLPAAGTVSAPILRKTITDSSVPLTPGKSELLARIDDINSTKRTQIEITATKLD